jgi:hypothetical protein
MEIAKVEIAALEKVAGVVLEADVVELNELQLAMIGGGTGEVSLG